MITLTLQHNSGEDKWFRSRWDEDEDPFKVIDEDFSPAHAVDHIQQAATHIRKALRILSDSEEGIVFNLRKYTNFDEFMTAENEVGLMLAILIAKNHGRAQITFRSERELVDVLGVFIANLLDSIDMDVMPEWMESLKDEKALMRDIPYSRTKKHAFLVCALAMNVLYGCGKKYDKQKYAKFGVIEEVA